MDERIRPIGGTKERRGEGAEGRRENSTPTPNTQHPTRRRLRLPWAAWLAIGVAVTALTGYLVAALVFFPAPLLESERAVAAVIGASQRDAERTLQRQGLRDSVINREPHPTASPGSVIWEDPPAGVAVPRGTTVSLIVSSGTPTVLVPDVRGYDAEIAQLIVTAAGLRVDTTDAAPGKDVPVGTAEGTTPAAGERVELRHAVTLHIARGDSL